MFRPSGPDHVLINTAPEFFPMPRPGYDIYARTMMVTMTLAGGGPAKGEAACSGGAARSEARAAAAATLCPAPT